MVKRSGLPQARRKGRKESQLWGGLSDMVRRLLYQNIIVYVHSTL